MKVGILGSGAVGQALGRGCAAIGHAVKIGSREPQKNELKAWLTAVGSLGSTGTFAEAAAFGEIVFLATAWTANESAIALATPAHLAGKIVIDVTNPLVFAPGKPPALGVGYTDSAGEQVQRLLPNSHIVKAFNIVGNAHFFKPSFPGGPPDMFICGNDAGAKRTVTDLCTAFGWPAIDAGGIEAARLLEPLAMLWISHGVRGGSWNHAFKLLRK